MSNMEQIKYGGGSNTCDVCGQSYNNGQLHRCMGKHNMFESPKTVEENNADNVLDTIFHTYWNSKCKWTKHTYEVKNFISMYPTLIKDCKLILISLDNISDEDCLNVAKIAYKAKFEQSVYDGKIIIFDIKNNRPVKNLRIHSTTLIAIIDYLRSRSYDCGCGTIRSLIDAGIAIETLKTSILDEPNIS